ncbi:efflux RND transporter periplasmic adaptor subunit [Rubripirellula reticaptiva]|uniref:Cation efflux system protein CusB n=1 Tax=Rubripirellula reticaptiva TaxID=2528013 RepID=A0A5C6F2C6_9BACT|nr:efflux RND transporter periplasmic adaptor subunit [Rubripirellula reticaptiva]TWU55983.1 Cation efflux system protein CusB precursor [Rubripirellula reticaptiva]
MNQDEPIKPDEADVDDQVSNVDADAPTDSEPVETATEATIPPVEAQPSVPQSGGGMKWLIRTGVQAATIVTVAGLVFFLLGIAQRTKWLTADGFSGSKGEAVAEAGGGEDKRYICPMMCTPPSTEPGRCPVCAMELVEATGGGGGDGISVTIEASARRLVGIQTAMSTMGEVNRTIRTIGSIDFDESQLSTISAYIDGRLEKMYANYAGVKVNEGDDLALIYSPQLYTAQTEFIMSMNSDGKIGRFQISGGDLNKMARENLAELGMTQGQIDQLGQSGKPMSRIRIKSPQSGTVIEKSAVEGDYVKTGHKLYRVADLSSVWLMLDLFPDDASAVRFGQQVEAEIQSMPGEVFTGRVAFIDPTVNATTRTVRVRVEIMNFDGKLRPGDYATARVTVPAIPMDQVYDPALANKFISPMHPQVIRDQPGKCPLCDMDLVPTSQLGFAAEPLPMQQVVTVPRDAVLLAGENSVIYVETEPGRFEIRRVTVGPMNRKEAVIVEGLSAGETVATGGNFLIDSQMQLAGNPSLMDPTKAPSYSPGPLELPNSIPVMLATDAGKALDRTYDAYFEIQCAMAADQTPPPVALNTLIAGLRELEMSAGVPDDAQRKFAIARRAASRMDGSLETAREAYRGVSHAMLKAATVARGPKTAVKLTHYYCPMVPGGGGDWMQPGGDLQNPYWGSEMLTCGEVVRDMAMPVGEVPSIARTVQ